MNMHVEVTRSRENPAQHEWAILSGTQVIRRSPETYATRREAFHAGEAALSEGATARKTSQLNQLAALRRAARLHHPISYTQR